MVYIFSLAVREYVYHDIMLYKYADACLMSWMCLDFAIVLDAPKNVLW
jgi:hypothetical protein